ncbi:Mediator of RNA polymerase II transcription subunit 22 [Thoreauomyces humboldtii]|nr:Mediator of RNA polymerase II transcription subunit 22 [Thoreauomyces humboldtii]
MSTLKTYTEEDLNKRLDTEIDVLLSNVEHIVEAATMRQPSLADADIQEPKDRARIAQERQLMHGCAANIVNSAQSLLALTSELKQALLLNDFKMLNATVHSRYLTVKDRERRCDDLLRDVVAVELQEQIVALEDVAAAAAVPSPSRGP